MNLRKKKQLAARKLGIGKNKIKFDTESLNEIKEAITSLDIQDLKKSNIISLKEKHGRLKKKKRKTRKQEGKIKKKVKQRKQDYVKLTRKLRTYVKSLKKQGKISGEQHRDIRKKIKSKQFRSKSHLKEQYEKNK